MQGLIDYKRLVEDCGGATRVAECIGVNRTQPYSWIKRQYSLTQTLMRIIVEFDVDIRDYIIKETNDNDDGRGTGTTGSGMAGDTYIAGNKKAAG